MVLLLQVWRPGRGFNGLGICGVAPEAELVGFRVNLFGATKTKIGWEYDLKGQPGTMADALEQWWSKIHIYNNSWRGWKLQKLFQREKIALKDGVRYGRYGLGSIFVFGGGNIGENYIDGQSQSDKLNSNYTAFANSRYTIAVAASSNLGRHSHYSAKGANILVNAPSSGGTAQISTTDRTDHEGYNPHEDVFGTDYQNFDYTNSFGGTSAAAPLVSGIIALMLQANSELTWRDVQYILVQAAEKNDPNDGDWRENGAGYPINHKYGFGRINAAEAVQLVHRWPTIPDEVDESRRPRKDSIVNNPIPDGFYNQAVSDTIEILDNIFVEFVEVKFTAKHNRWGDLKVTLTSPAGTHSVLAEQHPTSAGGGRQYKDWPFGSVRHFGESSQGDWTLSIQDQRAGDTGTFEFWELQLYGTELPTWEVDTPDSPGTCEDADGIATCSFEGGSVTLQPADEGNPALKFFADAAEQQAKPSEHHDGSYWISPREEESGQWIAVAARLVPQRSWFDLPKLSPETKTVPCDESLDEDTVYTADWSIEYDELSVGEGDQEHRRCIIRFVVNGKAIITSTVDAPGACMIEIPQPSSGTLKATVSDWVGGDIREEGHWIKADTWPGDTEEGRSELICKAGELTSWKLPYMLGNMEGLLEGWVYYYGCEPRGSWPPEEPEASTLCPSPDGITPEMLHDLSTSPPGKTCTRVEVGEFVELQQSDPEWSRCDPRASFSSPRFRCGISGGGYFPIRLEVKEYIDWEPVVTRCDITYTNPGTLTLVTDPSSTLPEVLGLIELSDESGPQGG